MGTLILSELGPRLPQTGVTAHLFWGQESQLCTWLPQGGDCTPIPGGGRGESPSGNTQFLGTARCAQCWGRGTQWLWDLTVLGVGSVGSSQTPPCLEEGLMIRGTWSTWAKGNCLWGEAEVGSAHR